MNLSPGIYTATELPLDAYHADTSAWNGSKLKHLVNADPWEFWKNVYGDPPEKKTASMVVGSLVHLMMEESTSGYAQISTYADLVPRVTEKAREASTMPYVINPTQARDVLLTYNALCASAEVQDMLDVTEMQVERTHVVEDKPTGLLVKLRPDLIDPDGIAADWKTTDSVRADDFARKMYNLGYAMSAAMVVDFCQCSRYHFIAVQNSYPNRVRVWECGESTLAYGRRQYRKALDTLAHCLETDTWPQTPAQPVIDLPDWAFSKEAQS